MDNDPILKCLEYHASAGGEYTYWGEQALIQYAALKADADRLAERLKNAQEELIYLRIASDKMKTNADRLAEFAQEVLKWSEAYPTKIFREPNPEQVNAALNQIGMSLDCFSAMVLRAFTKPWGGLARAALAAHEEVNQMLPKQTSGTHKRGEG